ncbi:MAG: hypothetical protein ACE15F_11405 [bacterium]
MESGRTYQHRFYRDGAPYAESLEKCLKTILSLAEGKNRQQDFFISLTLDLIRGIQVHLEECQTVLAKSEALVEEARARESGAEEIQKLVSLCLSLQEVQSRLAGQVIACSTRVIDEIFPR